MRSRKARWVVLFLFGMLGVPSLIAAANAHKATGPYTPVIPTTWDEQALANLEVPLSDPSHSPKEITKADYYRIPVRPIYKSYPIYHPDREPRGYRQSLRTKDPVVVWDDGAHRPNLVTEADWIKAGELVFNAPLLFTPQSDDDPAGERAFIAKTGDIFDKNGVSPFTTYVVRERGKLEIGEISCAECHSRVMADGTVIRGAQGNRPVEQVAFLGLADDAKQAEDGEAFLAEARQGQRRSFAAPWLAADPDARLAKFSAAEIEAVHFAIPPGVFARQGTSPFFPAKIPDLIGIQDRRYLDASGLVRHRGVGDLMRYAALNQGMDLLSRFGDFVPVDAKHRVGFAAARYSDEQLYALALYIYSLRPPPNPNRRPALAGNWDGQ